VIAILREGGVRGDARQIQRGLATLVDRFAPDELIVTVPVYEIGDRVRALEAITGKALAGADGDTSR
jgi:hypothetical protein